MTEPDPLQYDAVAAGYADHAESAPYNALYDRPAMLELIGDVRGKRVLDAGCGPGLYAEELVARGARVIGFDSSPTMISLATGRLGHGTADLRVHDLEQPLAWLDDGAVDIALMALVIHHVTNRLDLLRELHRVLAAGGSLVISTHHPTGDWLRLGGSYFEVAPVTETWSRGWEITTWRMPLTVMTDEFADAGFVIERIVEPQPHRSMRELFGDSYDKLMTEPAFIMFRLLKRPG